jgi:putative ABC transport system permease protein
MISYSLRDVLRNGRRTLASVVGVALGVGLFASIVFFIDGSAVTMTERAIAPVAIDMQVGLTSPLASSLALKQALSGNPNLAVGQTATMSLAVTNEGAGPATGVVIKDEPPAPLVYVPNTTDLNGRRLPDPEEGGPLILSGGVAAGTLVPKATATVTYLVRATSAVPSLPRLQVRGTASSREDPAPTQANAQRPIRQQELGQEVSRIAGITRIDRLSMVDLPERSLRAGAARVERPVRLFAFDPTYMTHYPRIVLNSGSFSPGTALVSAEAAKLLGAAAGSAISIAVPGRLQPIDLRVGGVVDVSQADALWTSRLSDNLGDFIYVPNAIVVSPDVFEAVIVPALQQDAASAIPVLKNQPIVELDLKIERALLNANPTDALNRTRGLRRAVERVAPGQTFVIDNLSDRLAIAVGDATSAKVLFLFLGLPGVLLAAFMTGYAGTLVAQAQRREIAILRSRGAEYRHLVRLLTVKTLAIATIGSVVGLGFGLLTLAALFGTARLTTAAPSDLLLSAAVAAGLGLLATGLALFLPGWFALRREVNEERREFEVARTPFWQRWRVDIILLVVAALIETITWFGGGFTPNQAENQALSLSFYVLLAPILAWIGATLLGARLVMLAAGLLPVRSGRRFGGLVSGTLLRGLKRRSRGLGTGTIGVTLALAFGTSVSVFVATYHAEKQADSSFIVGSDIRVTPSVLSPQPPAYANKLEQVTGVTAATPLMFHIHNAAVASDKKDMALIDPNSLERAVNLHDSFLCPASVRGLPGLSLPQSGDFCDLGAASAMATMRSDPTAILVDWELFRDYNMNVGDPLKLTLTDVYGRDVPAIFHIAARFKAFPGFPQHVDVVANLAQYQLSTGYTQADFFLVKAKDSSFQSVRSVAGSIRNGPGKSDPLFVSTTAEALDKDQSTLAALNLDGLASLESIYTALMSASAIAIFVFGLMLERRKEYVTLRALGIRLRHLQGLVIAESGLISVLGLAIGTLVGFGMAYLFVQVLRPVFTLPPEQLSLPRESLGILGGLVLFSMATSAILASGRLRKLKPMELLRED